MDYTDAGNKYWVVLSESDCLKLSFFGYSCFDLFFTVEDWNHITEIPSGGTTFFHHDPTAYQFLNYALTSDETPSEVYKMLTALHRNYENTMIECEFPMPFEWDFDIFQE